MFAQFMIRSQFLEKCAQGTELNLSVRPTRRIASRCFHFQRDLTLKRMKRTGLENRAVCNPGPDGIQHDSLKIPRVKNRRKPRLDGGIDRIQTRIIRQQRAFFGTAGQFDGR